jgi:hypothetical protein
MTPSKFRAKDKAGTKQAQINKQPNQATGSAANSQHPPGRDGRMAAPPSRSFFSCKVTRMQWTLMQWTLM